MTLTGLTIYTETFLVYRPHQETLDDDKSKIIRQKLGIMPLLCMIRQIFMRKLVSEAFYAYIRKA